MPDATIGHDEMREKVLRALKDPRWDFRTVDGIAKELHIEEVDVAAMIGELIDSGAARKSDVPDRIGRPLFTIASRPQPMMERLAKLRNFIAKSSE